MEEPLFVQQIAACLEEVTRGRLSDQILPRVSEPNLEAAVGDEALRRIACDVSGLTLLERIADARLAETHAERLDGLGVVATLVGQYIVFGSKHAATARSALKHLTEEQKQAVFSTTDTLAVVNEDADPLQRAVIRALTESPCDSSAQEVAHVFLNRMHARDLLKNLDNALTFCEEVQYLAMDMQPVGVSPGTLDTAVADDCPAGDPVELGIDAQLPAVQSAEPPTAEPASFSEDIRKLMLPASFGALTISPENAERSTSLGCISHPPTPPKTAVAPEPSSPEDDTQPQSEGPVTLGAQTQFESLKRDKPLKKVKPVKQKSDRGTSMSPERVNQPKHVFYTMAEDPFEDGAHVSPEQSSETVSDVVDEVLTRLDADFASPRTTPSATSAWSPSPKVGSAAKDVSFSQISATSPAASGDELFSQMYSAFMSSRRKAAAASSIAATAAATESAPRSGARSSSFRGGVDEL
jgi:hypothetical protein